MPPRRWHFAFESWQEGLGKTFPGQLDMSMIHRCGKASFTSRLHQQNIDESTTCHLHLFFLPIVLFGLTSPEVLCNWCLDM